MKECMMKLCNPKTGIIKKEDIKKPIFRADEKLRINHDFTSANIKVKYIP